MWHNRFFQIKAQRKLQGKRLNNLHNKDTYTEKKLAPIFIPQANVNSKCTIILNVRAKTTKIAQIKRK